MDAQTEQNVLIFDFMECRHSTDPTIDLWEMSGLKYRNSWDALIPVWSKVSDSLVHIANNENINRIRERLNSFQYYVDKNEIGEAFNEIIKCIEFINQQPKQ